MQEDKIERNLLEKMAANFVSVMNRHREQSMISKASERQSHFDANYKKH